MEQLTHLPHIRNSHAGLNQWDPIHNSIFEVTFTAPKKLEVVTDLFN